MGAVVVAESSHPGRPNADFVSLESRPLFVRDVSMVNDTGFGSTGAVELTSGGRDRIIVMKLSNWPRGSSGFHACCVLESVVSTWQGRVLPLL